MLKNLLVLALVLGLCLASNYTKHVHDISTGARCSDGSPASFLLHQGAEKSNILIYFIGGGFCNGNNMSSVLQSCYERSKTIVGTSNLIPNSINLDSLGVISTKQSSNPAYWNWTKIVIPYCDGSFHQGSRQEPINYKDATLYFRGTNNTLQHFKYLEDNYGLYTANKVVVTGESAGGIATFIWTDYIYERSSNKKVYSFPDSGLFITNYPNPKTGLPILTPKIRALFDIVNNEISVPMEECYGVTKDNMECMNFSASAKYFKAPLFIIESAYDEYSLSVILTERCMTESVHGSFSMDKCDQNSLKDIAAYRNATLTAINNFTSLKAFGAWVPACVQHGFSHEDGAWNGATYKIPTSTGSTLAHAAMSFINNPLDSNGNSHIDSVEWPLNKGCSAHANSNGLKKISERFNDLLKQYE